jgi:hypothetical protein
MDPYQQRPEQPQYPQQPGQYPPQQQFSQPQQSYPPQGQAGYPPAIPPQQQAGPYAQYQNPVPPDRPPQPQQHQGKHVDPLHPMVVLQPGERVIASVKRHPFGILTLYVGGLIGIIVAIVIAVLLPNMVGQYAGSGGNDIATYAYIGAGVVVVGLVAAMAIATSVYWQNEWVITSDSITQISQRSLFDRQVSQLSMDNLEDVTVDQNGILPHMFNFGQLKVETAGEHSKFTFQYCPNPNKYARDILEVHEEFLESRRNVQNTP